MKKRPILLKSIYGLNEQKNKKMIGLIGTHRGVGVTHTGLLMAEFLGNILGKKTAFLERNMHGDFAEIEQVYYRGEEWTNPFQIKKVNYYKQVTEQEIAEILNEEYEYFIFDFGTDIRKNRDEFLRCDKKIIIGSLADWKRNALRQFVEDHYNTVGHEKWLYLLVFGQKADLQEWRKEIGVQAKNIGYDPLPYSLSKETIGLFHSII